MTAPVRPAVSPDWAADVTLEAQGTAPLSTNDAIVPPSGYADNGWPLGIKPIRQYDNGIKRIHGDWLNYLSATSVPWFDSMRDALLYYASIVGNRYGVISSDRQQFVVNDQFTSVPVGRHGAVSSPNPVLAATPRAVVCDGFDIFLAAGTYIVALNASTGAESWRVDMGADVHSLALWREGRLLVGMTLGIIKQIDRVDGGNVTLVATLLASSNVTSIASDGDDAAARASTQAAVLMSPSYAPAAVTLTGAIAVTFSGQKMWVAYEDAGVQGVKVYTPGTPPTLAYTLTLPTASSTPTPNAICADGQFVVVVHEDDDNGHNIHVYTGGSEYSDAPEVLWSRASVGMDFCAIDDTAVYTAATSGEVFAYDRLTGAPLWSNSAYANMAGLFSNAHRLYGCFLDGANAKVVQFNLGNANRTYQLTDADGGTVIPQGLHAIPVR